MHVLGLIVHFFLVYTFCNIRSSHNLLIACLKGLPLWGTLQHLCGHLPTWIQCTKQVTVLPWGPVFMLSVQDNVPVLASCPATKFPAPHSWSFSFTSFSTWPPPKKVAGMTFSPLVNNTLWVAKGSLIGAKHFKQANIWEIKWLLNIRSATWTITLALHPGKLSLYSSGLFHSGKGWVMRWSGGPESMQDWLAGEEVAAVPLPLKESLAENIQLALSTPPWNVHKWEHLVAPGDTC